MKISTRGRYGLRAMVDLAAHYDGAPVSLLTVAERQKISLNYLEQVFGQLRKAGLVNSVKGPSGGYLPARESSRITVKEILEVLEGPFSICKEEMDANDPDPLRIAIRSLVWSEIDRSVNQFLEECTLRQLVEEYKGYRSGQELMFYI